MFDAITHFYEIPQLLKAMGMQEEIPNTAFHIFKLEDLFKGKNMSFSAYKQDFFELTIGGNQNVKIRVGTDTFTAFEDTISFTSPHQIASWEVNEFGEDAYGFMILFRLEYLQDQADLSEIHRAYPFFDLQTSPSLILSESQKNEIWQIIDRIYCEYQNTPEHSKLIRAYLYVLLEKINQIYKVEKRALSFGSRAEQIAYEFESMVANSAKSIPSIAACADELNISNAYLVEAVKKTTGRPPTAIISHYQLLRAKELLLHTNATLHSIAELVGFTEASNFASFFKRQTGITPGAFREKPVTG